MWKIKLFLLPTNSPFKLKLEAFVVISNEHIQKCRLRDEGEVGDFLGIIIEKTRKSRLHLTQI